MTLRNPPNQRLQRTRAARLPQSARSGISPVGGARRSPLSHQPFGDLSKRRLAAVAFSLFAMSSAAYGVVVRIDLTDRENNGHSQHMFDSQLGRAREVQASGCREINPANDFVIGGGRLIFAGQTLLKADELLAQGEAQGVGLAVVRYEYNSFANPWRILAAFTGHPIQVSQIIVVSVKNGHLASKATLKRRGAAYAWTAKLCQ